MSNDKVRWEIEDHYMTDEQLINLAKEYGYRGHSPEYAAQHLVMWGYLVHTKEGCSKNV